MMGQPIAPATSSAITESNSCASQHTGTWPLYKPPLILYCSHMIKTTQNPYVAQLYAQGKEPSKAPAPKASYPRQIGARVYQTEAEYNEAIADFLNGN